MAKHRKKRNERVQPEEPERDIDEKDTIDFPTVVWSLAILAVLVILHRLIWGG